MYSPRYRECPFIDRDIKPNPEFNERRTFTCEDGFVYVYYDHFDGYDTRYPCQFCRLCGRKRDVFECLNTDEWHSCSYYLLNAHLLRLRAQEEAA